MTGRYVSIADIVRNGIDPDGAHERHRRDEEIELRRGELELRAQVEQYRFRQDDAHHRDRIEQDERHHNDKMTALARSDQIDARRLDILDSRDREQLALGRERLSFDRENAATVAQTARDTALIQARTSLEVAKMQQDGALAVAELNHGNALTLAEINNRQAVTLAEMETERGVALAEMGHRHDIALAELNHTNALDLMRAQSHIASFDATTALSRESILSTIRKGEDTSKHLSAALGSILVEKVKGRIAERLEDQKERHRASERGHELTMAEKNARFARVGFTRDELIRAGYSPEDANEILARLVEAISRAGNNPDMGKLAAECLNEWEREQERRKGK